MSTITVTNIKATGETASRAVSGVAAAWIDFDGTGTVEIKDSLNATSLVDNATADYSFSYVSNMATTSYVTAFGGANPRGGTSWGKITTEKTRATGSMRVVSSSLNQTATDHEVCNTVFFGDLA